MDILYLTQRLPFPPDRGDRIPTYHHIKYLSRNHMVTVGSLISSPFDKGNSEKLQLMVNTVLVASQPFWKSCLGMLKSFLTNEPLSLGYFYNKQLHNKIQRHLKLNNCDVIVVFSSSMAQYVDKADKFPRIINFCDMDSEKWRILSFQASWIKSLIFKRETRKVQWYEKKIAGAFNLSCVVSKNEAEIFSELIPGSPVQILENGVDCSYFNFTPSGITIGQKLAFVGVMNYYPNVEAVVWFVKNVWKKVIHAFPSAVFTIIGSSPNKLIRSFQEVPGIQVTGYVENVPKFLNETTLLVIPLSVARGIQNKILEGMASGVPVLTTPVAAQGLKPGASETLWIVERKPEAFFQAIENIFKDPERSKSKARAAADFVKLHYSWESRGKQLEEMLKSVNTTHI